MSQLSPIRALLVALLLAPLPAAAQQQPAWQDIALQAQKNAVVDQMTANAIIGALQAEIAELQKQLSAKTPPAAAPPEVK